jgi:hypothetical protein
VAIERGERQRWRDLVPEHDVPVNGYCRFEIDLVPEHDVPVNGYYRFEIVGG